MVAESILDLCILTTCRQHLSVINLSQGHDAIIRNIQTFTAQILEKQTEQNVLVRRVAKHSHNYSPNTDPRGTRFIASWQNRSLSMRHASLLPPHVPHVLLQRPPTRAKAKLLALQKLGLKFWRTSIHGFQTYLATPNAFFGSPGTRAQANPLSLLLLLVNSTMLVAFAPSSSSIAVMLEPQTRNIFSLLLPIS
jgi:hypothetical protein